MFNAAKFNITATNNSGVATSLEKTEITAKDPNNSPELFEDESQCIYEENSQKESLKERITVNSLDKKLLEQISKDISGVLPLPPSLLRIHLNAHDILTKIEENKSLHFWKNAQNCKLLPEDFKHKEWPDILNSRGFGLHYNCGKISEEIADLTIKYQNRFIGAETESTCVISNKSSSAELFKLPNSLKISPGRRISHLARRRIFFPNSSLRGTENFSIKSRTKQILVDAKKIAQDNAETQFNFVKKNLAQSFENLSKKSENKENCIPKYTSKIPQQQNNLSETQKRKLLWAVNDALQSQNIKIDHPQWKLFAANLARITRRFFNIQLAAIGVKSDLGTSERMLRIAQYHVISVIKGKSVEEIVDGHLKQREKSYHPQGYVSKEEYEQNRTNLQKNLNESHSLNNSTVTTNNNNRKVLMDITNNDLKINCAKRIINFDNK